MKSKFQVYYHKGCVDGTTAAAMLYNKVPEGSLFTPIQYGDTITLDESIGNVVFVDFTPTKEMYEQIMSHLTDEGKLYIFDHHITGLNGFKEYYDNDPRVVFHYNQDKCGTMIASGLRTLEKMEVIELIDKDNIYSNIGAPSYDYEILSIGRRRFVRLIDIRDRWVDVDPEEKKLADRLSLFLGAGKYTSKPIEEVYRLTRNMKIHDVEEMCSLGEILEISNRNRAEAIIAKADKTFLRDSNGKTISLAIAIVEGNISDVGSLWSNTKTDEAEDRAMFVGVIFNIEKDEVILSVRSSKNVNAAFFCEMNGGGGHKSAAGCRLSKATTITYKDIKERILKTIRENPICD